MSDDRTRRAVLSIAGVRTLRRLSTTTSHVFADLDGVLLRASESLTAPWTT